MIEATFDRRSLLAAAAGAYALAFLPGCGSGARTPAIPGTSDPDILEGLAKAAADFAASARATLGSLDGELQRVVERIAEVSARQAAELGAVSGRGAPRQPRKPFSGTPADAVNGLRDEAAALARAQVGAITRLSGNKGRVAAGAALNTQSQELAMLYAISGRIPVPHSFVPDG